MEMDLMALLKDITGLDHLLALWGLEESLGCPQASIAQKMSWISRRKTTRVEDLAYSMLGVLGVNMPPLYGEGINAFLRRLQLELVKVSDNKSIFAWKLEHTSSSWESKHFRRSILVHHPCDFRDFRDVERYDFD